MEDHFHVADDIAVLVEPDVTSVHCYRRSHNADKRLSLSGTPDTGSFQHSAVDGEGSKPHYCHKTPTKTGKTARNQLIIVSALCALFMVAQIVGGILSNSLAIVTDATHMASDLASFLVSLLAIWLAKKPPNHKMTLGYHRAEVLGALTSILIIWAVTGVLVYVAARRINHGDYDIHADEMLIISSMGVLFNLIMGLVLHSSVFTKCHLPSSIGHNHSHGDNHDHDNSTHDNHHNGRGNHDNYNHGHGNRTNNPLHAINTTPGVNIERYGATSDPKIDVKISTRIKKTSINIQAATIHVLGDFIQSIGVFIAAVIIKVKPEYQIADPLCTFLFSILVLFTTVSVLRDVVTVLMEARPRDIDYHAIYNDLRQLDGVKSVHCLSLWSLTVNKTAATVHIAIDTSVDEEATLEGASGLLRHKYGAFTSTVQIERYTTLMEGCKLCQS